MEALTAAEMVQKAREHIDNLAPAAVVEEIERGATAVDIREQDEIDREGHIPGAVIAPRGMLEFWADPTSPYHRPEFEPDRRVVLYCASGGRSALAADTLRQMGYSQIAHMDGGMNAWKEQGHAVEHDA